jgi:hypothetical protein
MIEAANRQGRSTHNLPWNIRDLSGYLCALVDILLPIEAKP